MLENPTVYVNVDDDIDNLPNNVNIVYVTQGADVDEDGNIVFTTSASDGTGDAEVEPPQYADDQANATLRPPNVLFSTFTSTPYILADGSVGATLEFFVDEEYGADSYEVRYT